MRLARNQLPPLRPLLLRCRRLTRLPRPSWGSSNTPHPTSALISPGPEQAGSLPDSRGRVRRAALPAAREPSSNQTPPGNLFQEERSPEKNMFTAVSRVIDTSGERARQWKNLGDAPRERCSARLLSAARGSRGPRAAPAMARDAPAASVLGTAHTRGTDPGPQHHGTLPARISRPAPTVAGTGTPAAARFAHWCQLPPVPCPEPPRDRGTGSNAEPRGTASNAEPQGTGSDAEPRGTVSDAEPWGVMLSPAARGAMLSPRTRGAMLSPGALRSTLPAPAAPAIRLSGLLVGGRGKGERASERKAVPHSPDILG